MLVFAKALLYNVFVNPILIIELLPILYLETVTLQESSCSTSCGLILLNCRFCVLCAVDCMFRMFQSAIKLYFPPYEHSRLLWFPPTRCGLFTVSREAIPSVNASFWRHFKIDFLRHVTGKHTQVSKMAIAQKFPKPFLNKRNVKVYYYDTERYRVKKSPFHH